MKRLFFFVLMMFCSVSFADWEIGHVDDDFVLYYDKSTIRQDGVIAKMWVMKNYFTTQMTFDKKSYKSAKNFFHYNCKDELIILFSIALFPESSGRGSSVVSVTLKENEMNWKPVVPGSIDEENWKIACGRK